jgi:hypothetical protein
VEEHLSFRRFLKGEMDGQYSLRRIHNNLWAVGSCRGARETRRHIL